MNKDNKIWHQGACHCGQVSFKVCAPENIEIIDCNCSICNKTGYQHLIVEAADFCVLSGEDALTTYTFNTHTARHLFCKICGVKPFYTPRSHPDGVSVNLRCVDQSGFKKITALAFDGANWQANISSLK